MHAALDFRSLVQTVVERFYQQNQRSLPAPAELEALAGRLVQLIDRRGLPAPLAKGDPGSPGGLPDAEIASLVAHLIASGADEFLTDVARQLVKACFYPEFTVCRNSYQERGKDGACRRQEEPRARRRLSGVHCVDCPHWAALEIAPHEALLTAAWHAGEKAFKENQGIFLPEDFRALRQMLWLESRARR